MLHHKDTMWRIDFRCDLTRADAPSLPLAFMLETHWADGVRWLGMLFRKRLTALELESVDVSTWSELKTLESFMKGLFDEAWNAVPADVGAAQMPLGSTLVAAKYPLQSALHFAAVPNKAVIRDDDHKKAFQHLYSYLLGLGDSLTPVLVAPVVRLPTKKRAAPAVRPDLEIANRAA